MFSTCLHCTKDLGTNEIVETLPIGRRLAFDAAQGRLWAVCRHCAKWNLVPFDTRLESIDACERLYRDTKTRYATDNIGLARVKEGLELVRIGEPLRPEFASWRYGDAFGKRRRRNIMIAAGLVAIPWAAVGLGVMAGAALGGFAAWPYQYYQWRMIHRVRVRLPREGATPIELNDMQIGQGKLARGSDGDLLFRTSVNATLLGRSNARYEIAGPDLDRLLPLILPRVNQWHSRPRTIQSAVALVAETPRPQDLLLTAERTERSRRWGGRGTLQAIKPEWLLAAEIASHESREQEALNGELKLLEWEWREAERLAKISDDLQLDSQQRPANGEQR
jgi:hypothetical protein